jgi:hypothetical protein
MPLPTRLLRKALAPKMPWSPLKTPGSAPSGNVVVLLVIAPIRNCEGLPAGETAFTVIPPLVEVDDG